MSDYCAREHDTLRVTLGTDSSREMIERFREKFVKEACNIAALDHPNIVRVIDVFEENGTAYYVMEYHSAGSLGSLVDNRGALNEDDALYYIRQVASALKYVHSRKMMHLDIKPDNILVNSRGEAVLIDFGLSKRYDNKGKATSTTPVGVSHGYAPIEQYNPGGVGEFSPTTDIYSLAATLFTLLTGESPLPAPQLVDSSSLQSVLAEKNVSGAVAATIIRSMSFMREARPQSIAEFLSMLDAQPSSSNSAPLSSSTLNSGTVSRSVEEKGDGTSCQTAPTDNDSEEVSRSAASTLNSGTVSRSVEEKGGISRQTAPMDNDRGAVSRPTEPKSSGSGVSRPTAPMNNNGAATADNEPNFNWKVPAGVVAAILCLVFAGVGIKDCVEEIRLEKLAAKSCIEKLKGCNYYTVEIGDVSFKMVAVEGGTFNMGSNDSEAYINEKPVHSVTLSDYYIGETEVTQALWKAVMGSNPSKFKGSSNPVEEVSYNDCIDFINKLNTLLAGQLPAGRKFRLPTEAEWEFAARGGNKGKNNNYKYSGSNSIDAVAWYDGNIGDKTHPVKGKQPNELGLYDMSGNVDEWCNDCYGSDYYSSSPQTNPQGPSSGEFRVFRGGSWYNGVQGCRVALRSCDGPDNRYSYSGLRLAF